MEVTNKDLKDILLNLGDTMYLILFTGVFVIFLGLVIGVLLFISSNDLIYERRRFSKIANKVLSIICNICRSLPFVILSTLITPLTIFLTGTMLGKEAALPALIISVSPFFGQIVFNALNDVPKGNIEAAKAMGASKVRIVLIIVQEAMPSLISGLTVTLVTLVGFIAIAGAIGAGGLGQYAIDSAFMLKNGPMLIAVGLMLLIIFIIQFTGDFIAKKIDRR